MEKEIVLVGQMAASTFAFKPLSAKVKGKRLGHKDNGRNHSQIFIKI